MAEDGVVLEKTKQALRHVPKSRPMETKEESLHHAGQKQIFNLERTIMQALPRIQETKSRRSLVDSTQFFATSAGLLSSLQDLQNQLAVTALYNQLVDNSAKQRNDSAMLVSLLSALAASPQQDILTNTTDAFQHLRRI